MSANNAAQQDSQQHTYQAMIQRSSMDALRPDADSVPKSTASPLYESYPISFYLALIFGVLLLIATLWAVLFSVLYFVLKANTTQYDTFDDPHIIDIIMFNDVYELTAKVMQNNISRGGVSRAAYYIQQVRNRRKAFPNHVLVFSGGDMLSPSSLSSLFRGSQMVEVNNYLGLNASVLGNHELYATFSF